MEFKAESSVGEFFRELLDEALRDQGVEAAEPTEFYLVNMLAQYCHSAPDFEEPLALKLARARQASPEERAQQLREIADSALYYTGFFAEALHRKMVDLDYYVAIGGGAYAELASSRLARKLEVLREAFAELSHKFARFVDVLASISEQTGLPTSADALRLYDEFLRTGSERAARRLRSHGLLPLDPRLARRILH